MTASSEAVGSGAGAPRVGGRSRRWLVLLGFGATFLALARDGRLYWHDVRYLYATTHHSLAELFAGAWNPQYGEALDPAASGGFYLVKFTLLAALEGLFAVWPAEQGGFELAVWLSTAMVFTGICVARVVVNRFALACGDRAVVNRFALACGDEAAGDERSRAAAGRWPDLGTPTAALLFVTPALWWLGGKLLGEAPALLCSMLAAWLLLRPDGRPARWPSGWAAGVLVLHVLAVAARPNFGLVVPAACAALAFAGPADRRSAWLGWAGALVVGQAATHLVLFSAYGGAASFFGYLGEYVAGSRSWLVSAVGGLAALGVAGPLALLAARSQRRALRTGLLAWTALSFGPALAFAALYQVEARYLLPGLVPLAGLAALGCEVLGVWWARRTEGRSAVRIAGASALVVVGVASNVLAGSVLPDEIDREALARIVRSDALEDGRRPLLVAWAYSDYHYLVTLEPDRDVRFAHVPRRDGVLAPYSPEWRARLADWYGEDRLVLERTVLDGLLAEGPVYLLWWGIHPPLERWARRLDAWGLGGWATAVRGLGGDDHGDQTWIVEESDLVRIPVAEHGPYRLLRIEPAPQDQ